MQLQAIPDLFCFIPLHNLTCTATAPPRCYFYCGRFVQQARSSGPLSACAHSQGSLGIRADSGICGFGRRRRTQELG